jgi:hypothetical protein
MSGIIVAEVCIPAIKAPSIINKTGHLIIVLPKCQNLLMQEWVTECRFRDITSGFIAIIYLSKYVWATYCGSIPFRMEWISEFERLYETLRGIVVSEVTFISIGEPMRA